ncbi:MAG: hypothetical protein COZ06_07090 [Armatimonadetes bacterium CG_4_10_14_3_um_filter_66_18]|nr:hypothetical protein [Armatimonadota bacterium]OIO97120.1 MAG: hypothetical protein AUJ96_23830 [Armatimonadetes bacterium CG2_30_66_41]PIU91548.1 MAG: hypothetical protein COS65_21785 [Armatimonadetes bacterium CG06_land_8_20_14_3_00_66_21]PIY50881.1 MAG: hypothetical protein COZ06_07090 [Armatimonadetes bacterium CG_4_10_14_3_um_filter_66_18]PIZ36968.1 MAG: hypothetical protein COY42_24850 [Armatimonadetes bacterium CG_4_10_14_0_8_um_filter_66_14]PJB60723.1 MAG: hypothetical protein CO096
MDSIRDRFERMTQQFADQTQQLAGVVEVAVVGSTATDTVEPGDLDLAVLIDSRDAVEGVARAARRLTSISHKWAVWILSAADRSFIGWVGVKKVEPLLVDPNFDFDERLFLNVEPQVLWSRAGGILPAWRNEVMEKAALVGWSLPKPLSDRRLKCLDCGEAWVWTAHQQKVFREHGWKSPIRCHDCRAYRCAICGRKTALSRREADAKEIFACEYCAAELGEMTDWEGVDSHVEGAPVGTLDFGLDDDLDDF